MKKKILTAALAVLMFFGVALFTACGNEKNGDKLEVFTSFYPIYYFATTIGGDKVNVTNLVEPGKEAHGHEISAQQIAKMTTGDLIIINGLNMESWVGKLSSRLQEKVLDTSFGTNVIERSSNQDNDHSHDEGHDHNEEDGHNHGTSDPHIWLSLKNAVVQMRNIAEKFAELDTKNANYYLTRFESQKLLFESLDNKYEQLLSSHAGKTFVVAHRAFGYIANEYNLVQYSLSGIDSVEEPDARTMSEVIDFINANNIRVVFFQSNSSSDTAQTIASSTNAIVLELSTLESLSQNQTKAGDNYLTIMAQNLHYLTLAFAQ